MDEVIAHLLGDLQAYTCTEDGDRIILTFETEDRPYTISFPERNVQNVVAGIAIAAGIAKRAQTSKVTPLAMQAQSFRFRRHKTRDEAYFVVDLPGGLELVFRTNRQSAKRFAEGLAQEFGLISPGKPEGSLQ